MITLIFGKPGKGKTYILTEKADKELKLGREVWSNYYLEWKGDNLHYYNDLKEIKNVENALILMDEAQIYLNSRYWESLELDFQIKLQQHRKDGLDIWACAQHPKRLDIVARELVQDLFKACSIMLFGFGAFWLIEYDSDYIDDVKTEPGRMTSQWFFHWPKKPRKYDTMKKVPIPQKEFFFKKFANCKECGKIHEVR